MTLRLAPKEGATARPVTDGLVTTQETVFEGLDRAPEALVRMLAGQTTGKTLVRIP